MKINVARQHDNTDLDDFGQSLQRAFDILEAARTREPGKDNISLYVPLDSLKALDAYVGFHADRRTKLLAYGRMDFFFAGVTFMLAICNAAAQQLVGALFLASLAALYMIFGSRRT